MTPRFISEQDEDDLFVFYILFPRCFSFMCCVYASVSRLFEIIMNKSLKKFLETNFEIDSWVFGPASRSICLQSLIPCLNLIKSTEQGRQIASNQIRVCSQNFVASLLCLSAILNCLLCAIYDQHENIEYLKLVETYNMIFTTIFFAGSINQFLILVFEREFLSMWGLYTCAVYVVLCIALGFYNAFSESRVTDYIQGYTVATYASNEDNEQIDTTLV